MSDTRWLEIEDDLAAAVTHFSRSLALHHAGGFEGETLEAYRAQMALMHGMQSGHTSLESMLVRIMGLLGEDLPTGSNWHADLLARSARALPTRPAILSPGAAQAANETRRLSQGAMRTYGQFSAGRAGPALEAAASLASLLPGEIASFRAVMDGD